MSSPVDSGQGSSPKVTRTALFCAPSALAAGASLASCARAGATSASAAASARRGADVIAIRSSLEPSPQSAVGDRDEPDRTSVVEGESVSVRVGLGGDRINKTKKQNTT